MFYEIRQSSHHVLLERVLRLLGQLRQAKDEAKECEVGQAGLRAQQEGLLAQVARQRGQILSE